MTRDNKNRTIAIAVTVAVHALVVVLLVIMALHGPWPLPGEAGVEVNLGMYNEGMGNQQQPKPKEVVSVPKPQPQQVKEETVTQNTEEAPAFEEPKPQKEEPKVNERALFKPTNKPEEQPSSEGITGNPGDQGNPNGGQNIPNYEGQGGAGGGPSFDLGGRGAKSLPHPSKDGVTEEGTIVVDIWVDRDGRVQNAKIGKGTTITNTRMRQEAINAAKKSVFAPDKDAAELQKGTITYYYTLRQ
ncbi:MAG: TonB family protein [Bacteroidales bacterium]|nr:TonB family protein [Bacteroidales bacterium]